ncbi:N-acetylmuramoyl-L-alanine amidase [Paenalkalicoccus suaedae]|uniref:N-acetylmuramoyl-L-alanine amidase n=1 Tax=Paenalkalicoccus suaedae TaxID=2592382 RepID=A0A859FGY7_9BACI|nr:N-acetylmuramoyl-L-alanine amidase [Paenalkalicoccus suaedae]QKS72387.1 N-acetylmuramoyl-L-alanine amidase [Paenalkalicoccus suaedae]
MRNRIIVVLAACFLAFAIIGFNPNEASAISVGTVTSSTDLNVREGPSTSFRSIDRLPSGTPVHILETANGWHKIQHSGNVAYVSASYVRTIPIPANGSGNTRAIVNGNVLQTDARVINDRGTTLVPYRAIGDALGINVRWDQANREVHAQDGNKRVMFQIDQKKVFVDGNEIQGAVPADIRQGVTYVPLRFFAQTFGADVYWHQTSRSAYVSRLFVPGSEVLPTPPAPAPIGTEAVVTASSLNVRSAPNASAPRLGGLPNGTIVIVESESNGWAQITFQGQKGYVSSSFLNMGGPASPGLSGKTIVLDAGHGGTDPGAVAGGMNEKDLIFDVAKRAERLLTAAGANVVMTRDRDIFLSLAERVRIAERSNADVFISVHANAFSNPAANGTETFYSTRYSSQSSKKLAEDIHRIMVAKLQTTDRGVKEGNYHVIRETTMPSVLLELGFMTNSSDAQKLRTDAYRQRSAEAIFEGLQQYFK